MNIARYPLIFLLFLTSPNSQSQATQKGTAPAVASPTADAKPYWAGLSVADADVSAKWYEEKLHFTLTRKMDLPEHKLRIRFLDLNGFTLELITFEDSVSFEAVQKRVPELKDRDKLQGFLKLGFRVSNVDVLATELKRNGVKLMVEPTDDRAFGDRFIMLKDLDGNVLQFFQELK